MNQGEISGPAEVVVLSEDQKDALKRESMASLRETKNIHIDSIINEKIGIDFLREIRERKRKFTEIVEPMRKSTHEAYQAVLDFRKALIVPLEQAESELSMALGSFRKAERERERVQQAVIIARIEQEERESREALAQSHEKQGDHTAATMLRETPVQLNPETFETHAETALAAGETGASYREQWACEVVDMKELCRAVADGVVSQELVRPNAAELNALARGMKKHLNIPGLRAVMKLVPVTRR